MACFVGSLQLIDIIIIINIYIWKQLVSNILFVSDISYYLLLVNLQTKCLSIPMYEYFKPFIDCVCTLECVLSLCFVSKFQAIDRIFCFFIPVIINQVLN